MRLYLIKKYQQALNSATKLDWSECRCAMFHSLDVPLGPAGVVSGRSDGGGLEHQPALAAAAVTFHASAGCRAIVRPALLQDATPVLYS